CRFPPSPRRISADISRRSAHNVLIRSPAFRLHHQAGPTTSCGCAMAESAILVADSVTRLGSEHVGAVLIAGSHGGVYAACLAAAERLKTAPLPVTRPPPMAESRHLLLEAPGGIKIWALDSASLVRPDDAGQIVLVGSHGGGPPANALKADCAAAIFNDAGIG